MKPFDINLAKQGKPVCTREGREARIICFDVKNGNYPIVAAVKDEGGVEYAGIYTDDGYCYVDKSKSADDLMMRGEKKKGYAALFKPIEGDFLAYCSSVYETPEEVRENICHADCTDIVEIEWEE